LILAIVELPEEHTSASWYESKEWVDHQKPPLLSLLLQMDHPHPHLFTSHWLLVPMPPMVNQLNKLPSAVTAEF
jgi:hypothetical protein